MSLLSIVNRAALLCGQPSLTNATPQWTALANMALSDLIDRHDWSALRKVLTIAGDGVASTWALPADYGRPARQPFISRFEAPEAFWPAGPLDAAAWQRATTYATSVVSPVFRIDGAALRLFPVPAAGETYNIVYQSSHAVIGLNGNEALPEFFSNNDRAAIPEDIIALSVIWRWKQIKGFEYQEDMNSAERALERAASRDAGLMAISATSLVRDACPEIGDIKVNV